MWFDGAWVVTLADPDDPHRHRAEATTVAGDTRWAVRYWRGEELVSSGGINTPQPHAAPVTMMGVTLAGLRTEADYRAARGGPPE